MNLIDTAKGLYRIAVFNKLQINIKGVKDLSQKMIQIHYDTCGTKERQTHSTGQELGVQAVTGFRGRRLQ